MKITRRDLLKSAALASVAPMLNRGRFQLFAHVPTEYSTRSIDLIGRATVIDMLAVLTLDFNKQAKWFNDPETFQTSDVQPYIDSSINVFHQSVGLGGPNAYESALQYFARWNGFIANDTDHSCASTASRISNA
jgi:membrane dipeptidase